MPISAPQPVVDLFIAQHGFVRRAEAIKAGLKRHVLERAIGAGEVRLLPGHVLCPGGPAPGDEHLRAAVVALNGVLSHLSAARLWGIELHDAPDGDHLTVARNRSRLLCKGFTVYRSDLSAKEIAVRDGIRLTTVVRTLVDLCRLLPAEQALVAVESALRKGLVTHGQLRRALVALPAGRGRARVVAVVVAADPASGSVLETLFRFLATVAGLPPECTQETVRDVHGELIGRVDFAWPSRRLVVETDGYAFHSDVSAFGKDLRRGNRLVLAGWRLLRFTWDDVVHRPEELLATLRAALEGSEPVAA